MDSDLFDLELSDDFEKDLIRLIKNDKKLLKRFENRLKQLSIDPKHNSLKSHKVDTKKFDDVWSSSITGDIRIIWIYAPNKDKIIVLLQTGSHSGSNKVYK